METTVKRFGDWQTLLDEFIQSRRTVSFAWGQQDCCLFAADAVLAITGVDIAAEFRGKYSDARGAFEILGDSDVGEFAAGVCEQLGIREVKPAFAQRGDLVLLNNGGNEALGIVGLAGDEVWSAGEFVLERAPYSEIIRAWRI